MPGCRRAHHQRGPARRPQYAATGRRCTDFGIMKIAGAGHAAAPLPARHARAAPRWPAPAASILCPAGMTRSRGAGAGGHIALTGGRPTAPCRLSISSAPRRPMTGEPREFRIGLVMAGAISAGAYTAGVMDFLLEALEAWEAAKRADPTSVPSHAARIRALSGASAGAMVSAITVRSLATRVTPDRQRRRAAGRARGRPGAAGRGIQEPVLRRLGAEHRHPPPPRRARPQSRRRPRSYRSSTAAFWPRSPTMC